MKEHIDEALTLDVVLVCEPLDMLIIMMPLHVIAWVLQPKHGDLGLGNHTHGGMLDFGIWWLDAHDMETLSIEALQDVDVASPQDLKPLAKTLDNIMKPSQALNDPHDVHNS